MLCHNYQNFVNGYNDYFFKNFNRNTNDYAKNNADGIISLFNFDRRMSQLVLSNILNIERHFSNCFITAVCKFKRNYMDGKIFALKKNDFDLLFDLSSEENKIKYNYIKEKWNQPFEKNLNNNLIKKYLNNKNEIPLWSICIFWSFDFLMNFFQILNIKIKNNILKIMFSNKIKINVSQFYSIMVVIKNIRNRICHNNVFYNFKCRSKELSNFLQANGLNSSRIRIFEIIYIIEKFNFKISLAESKLLELIKNELFNKIENNPNILEKIKSKILLSLGFKKYNKKLI